MRAVRLLTAAVLAVVLVVAVPASATAVEPPPGPVVEVPDIPSRTVATAPAGTWNEGKVLQMWRAMLSKKSTEVAVITSLPRPITPAATLLRGAGGSQILPFYLGYGVGTAGLYVYAGATGTTYDKLICQTPSWYQGVNDFIALGFAPTCYGQVMTPNSDQSQTMTLAYSGMTFTYRGSFVSGTNRNYCWGRTGTLVTSGVSYQMQLGDGSWSTGTIGGGTFTPQACDTALSLAANSTQNWMSESSSLAAGSGRLRILSSPGGSVLATMNAPDAVNPTRSLKCSITWPDSTTTTGAGASYTDTGGIPVDAQSLGCKTAWDAKPNGGLPTRIKVDSDKGGGAITTIADTTVPSETTEQKKALTTGNGHGLVLEKINGSAWSSCMTWAANCAGWWSSTSSGTVTGTYRCTYGGSVITLAECGVYRNTFDEQTQTPTITDPQTGTQQPWTAQPSTGNSIDPSVGPGTGANPAGACFETGWSDVQNPVDWVLVPVKCALVWAFVPRSPVVQTAVQSAGAQWVGKPPAVVAGFLGGLALAPHPTGCALSVTLFDVTFNVIDNCPGSFMAPITVISKVLTSLAMLILVIVVVRRQVAGMVGYDNDH